MSSRFRPRVESLEGRDVPAAFSFQMEDGTTGMGVFSTPEGVDPTQSFQSLPLTDLDINLSEVGWMGGSGSANYAYGVLVGVTGRSGLNTGGWVRVDNATGAAWNGSGNPFEGEPISLTYDAAETMAVFTLPDGTAGAISFTIPWNQVDPDQASQSLTPTAFNLNIAGRNFTSGSSYTTAPTLLFANGEFVGVNFALDTSATAGFAYSSLSMSGWNVTAVPIGGGQPIFTAAAPKTTFLSFDFSDCRTADYTYSLTITVSYTGGVPDKTVTITVENGTTKGGLRDMIYSALKDEGVVVEPFGDYRLGVKGTAANHMSFVKFEATKPANQPLDPTIKKVFQAGRNSLPNLNPNWDVKVVSP